LTVDKSFLSRMSFFYKFGEPVEVSSSHLILCRKTPLAINNCIFNQPIYTLKTNIILNSKIRY